MPRGIYERSSEQREFFRGLSKITQAEELQTLTNELRGEFTSLFQEYTEEQTKTLLGVLPSSSDRSLLKEFIDAVDKNPFNLAGQIALVDFMYARLQIMREIYLSGRKRYNQTVETRLMKFDELSMRMIELRKKLVEAKFKIDTASFITPQDFFRFLDWIILILRTNIKDEYDKARILEQIRNVPSEFPALKG